MEAERKSFLPTRKADDLSFAPELDGLYCFETIKSRPSSMEKAKKVVALPRTKSELMRFALEMDGLNWFETVAPAPDFAAARQPAPAPGAERKAATATNLVLVRALSPQQRMMSFAPEFDGLYCFETIIS